MSKTARVAPEAETPVNPYSLLDAVNTSSANAYAAWLIFIALMMVLMVAVAGVTHKSLLLQTPVALPILQVNIEQRRFFLFAPVLAVFLHLGLLSQLVLFARKALAFDAAIRTLELTDRRTHPLRLELHTFFLAQAVAGPHRSAIVSAFLHGMSWVTLVGLPVIVLLTIHIVFLPAHDITATWMHRAALTVDVVLLILIGIFLLRGETSFFQAAWRTVVHHPVTVIFIASVLTIVTFFSYLVATVPDDVLDRMRRDLVGLVGSGSSQPRVIAGFTTAFLSHVDGSMLGLFHRNLIVTDQNLVAKDAPPEGASINLRGRDLRYARLDRTDLHRADLTGADLAGASLVGADLRDVHLECVDASQPILNEDRKRALCASARGANLARARLAGARMAGADLRDATFEEADLEEAELSGALLSGANFSNAHLEKTDLTGGTQLQGAKFLLATLQGADLTGAQAQFADFSSASMQAVVLTSAHLHGAVFRDAHLEGSDLSQAKLHGADLTGARMHGVDLGRAVAWKTPPPHADHVHLADMTEIMLKPPAESDIAGLSAMLDWLDNGGLRGKVKEALAPLINPSAGGDWELSQEQQRWQIHVAAASSTQFDGYKTELTEYLARLMCRPRWSNGAVATGVAKRAQALHFRGNMMTIHDRLKAPECAVSESVSKKAFRDLAVAVDDLRHD
jgi:uncharacterized protein YjbI with pentapeptide repeats